eukprot:TRINITY_DN79144_c0_g1_i1.p1 TRINITY_DN79144_c0_g1~~TRINITY_DN79144_c0_g1_i1.p1  ORF type:complete len:300 (-),score=53.09 TRINITY_DN79144_c0_g1_i1:71-937(-)
MGCRTSRYKTSVVIIEDERREGSIREHPPELPEYWVTQDAAEDFHNVVECGTEELMIMQELLNGTLRSSPGEEVRALKIEKLFRIEDLRMWARYERSVECLSEARLQEDEPVEVIRTPHYGSLQEKPLTLKAAPKALRNRLRLECNEAYLWHGTDRKSAESITGHSFDMQRAGKVNAKALGKGAYFAEAASLSDKYSSPGKDGLHTLLLVRAALGKVYVETRYTKWRGGKLRKMVSTSKLVKKGRYDSVLGDRKFAFNMDVREYVVANNTQLYPEYMLLYSRSDANAK